MSQGVAYQGDIGRGLEAYVPEQETEYALQMGYENDPELAVVEIEDISADATYGGYKILATLPDNLLERYGDLLVYIVASDGDMIMTKYEGRIPVHRKAEAEE